MDNYLWPIQGVLHVLQDLFPWIKFPQLCILRTSSGLRDRQHCHLDNDKIQLSDTLIRTYEDVSYSCFFGLEDNTFLGLATYNKETKRLEREMVHIPPGAMLMISGNMIRYGSMYRGSSTSPDSYPAPKVPILMDHITCATFIKPKKFQTDIQSQVWFVDDEEPKSSIDDREQRDDVVIDNQISLHTSSTR